jgi:hypothetical protein
MTKWGVNWVIVMNYLFFDMNNATLLYQFFRRLRVREGGAERLKRPRDLRERESEETERAKRPRDREMLVLVGKLSA